MKRARGTRGRILIGVVGLSLAVAAPSVLAAGTPGNFRLAPTSPETVSGDRTETMVAAKLDDEPGTDLAVVNTFTSIAILSGEGDGDFTEIGTEAVSDAPREITAADLDGKNGTDLAVLTANSLELNILLNDGSGDFEEPDTSPETSSGGGITSAKFDDDEDIDLAMDGLVLLNDGSGDFTAGDSFSFPAADRPLQNADLDDDGDRDLVGYNVFTDNAQVSFNDGDANFTDAAIYEVPGGADTFGIAVGRIGRGSSPDIAVGTSAGVHLLLNDGEGSFTLSPRSPLRSGRHFNGVHIGDVDGDGRGDVAAGEAVTDDGPGCVPFCPTTPWVAVFLSNRRGRFTEPDTSPEAVAGFGAPLLAAGKFDARKGADLAASANAVSILLNRSP